MGLKIDSQTGNIINLGTTGQLTIQGPVTINVTGEIPLSDILSGKTRLIQKTEDEKENPEELTSSPDLSTLSPKERVQLRAMETVDELYRRNNPFMAVEGVTGIHQNELNPRIRLRPSERKPYHKVEHPDGTILHGIIFKVTIPEPPIGKKDIVDELNLTPGCFNEKIEAFLTGPAELYKIHNFRFEGRTISGAINEEDMDWDWKWDRPETIRKMLISYVNDIFDACAAGTECLKFRMCCSFAVGDYYIENGNICGETYNEVNLIHSGMDRLFTPLDTDYETKYEYETKEFKESRKRFYCTTYSNVDYLDEGIIIGTRDVPFIGGYGNWYRPVLYNQYKDSAAVILYEKKTMPGQPVKLRVKLKRTVHRIWKSIKHKYYSIKYPNIRKEYSL